MTVPSTSGALFSYFSGQTEANHAMGAHDVHQQLTEEQLRIRTRLLCILLTVVFLARQHIALRKLPFVAKLVHSLLVVAENAECQEIQFTAQNESSLREPLRRDCIGPSGLGSRLAGTASGLRASAAVRKRDLSVLRLVRHIETNTGRQS